MKLLHVITGVNVGGAETMLARLLESGHLAPDILPEVATLMSPGFVGQRIADTGVRVHDLGMRSVASALPAGIQLAALVRRLRPDVIMGWMHHGQLAASCAAFAVRRGTPVIWNVRHSLAEYTREKRLTRAVLQLQALLSRTPAAIVYNSRAGAKQYRSFGFSPRREYVIPNGFPKSEVSDRNLAVARIHDLFGIEPGIPLIGMVARAHPMKDVPNLVSAFARFHKAGVRAHLLLVGDGMDCPPPQLAEALTHLPHDSWTLSGQRGDVPTWLGGLDVLVLPSAWGEGFPNIVGEAMAAGVPCVGTDVGDTGWVIGATGRTVPPRNPVALADALIEMVQMNATDRAALGAAARQRIHDRFELTNVVAQYASLCREVADALVVPTVHPAAAAICEVA
jgi:glycosyltransferase involved in cell wall biosynthesis